MDTFAHGLISYLTFGRSKKKSYPFLAIFFGMLPDLFSWTIFMLYSIIFVGASAGGRPNLSAIPDWVFTLYGLTHSVFVFGIVVGLIYLIWKSIPVYIWAWGLHILIDIPTHSREFLPTPFLWPVSNWHFPGFSWGTSWFFISYWCVLLVWVAIIVVRKFRKKK